VNRRFGGTSVHTISTRRHIQEDGIPHNHYRENLESYILKGFIDSVINSKGSSHPNKEEKPLGSVYVPCVNGIRRSSNV
jgi:hypothetical protein